RLLGIVSVGELSDPERGTVRWLFAGLAIALLFGLAAAYAIASLALRDAERRSTFAAMVSHELRTPLTSIRMYAELLEGGAIGTEGERADYYRTIREEAERLGGLIDGVL